MSRSIALVSTGGAASLQAFATTLVGKATSNSVSLAAAAPVAGATAVAIGAAAPANVHTAIVSPAGNGSQLYAGVKTVLVRAVLPAAADQLALRDSVDVLPASGIKSDAEHKEAVASFKLTANAALAAAKAQSAVKVTALVKQVSKYENINTLFAEAFDEVFEGSGVAVEYQNSAAVVNQLIMFPENLGVVVTADTPTAEVVEGMFAGVLGGVSTSYLGRGQEKIAAGNSTNGVAFAVADALKAQGLTAEAAKIVAAIAKATPNDDGKSILAAL
jgi:hypothetical protein